MVIALKHKLDGDLIEKSSGENLEDCVEGVGQTKAFFRDGDQGIGGHRGPDLDFDGIGRGSKETLDAQMLLDPFEEQLNLPALMVDSCNNG